MNFVGSGQLNDTTVDDKSLIEFLLFDCDKLETSVDTNSFKHNFYVGRMNDFFETTTEGQLVQRDVSHPQKKIYLSARCHKAQKYYSLTYKDDQPMSFLLYLKDAGAQHFLKKIQKGKSTVS